MLLAIEIAINVSLFIGLLIFKKDFVAYQIELFIICFLIESDCHLGDYFAKAKRTVSDFKDISYKMFRVFLLLTRWLRIILPCVGFISRNEKVHK